LAKKRDKRHPGVNTCLLLFGRREQLGGDEPRDQRGQSVERLGPHIQGARRARPTAIKTMRKSRQRQGQIFRARIRSTPCAAHQTFI
jgi:hypothetical protein